MSQAQIIFDNPFRPGAGHMPPYLAGRTAEQDDIRRLLKQTIVLDFPLLDRKSVV